MKQLSLGSVILLALFGGATDADAQHAPNPIAASFNQLVAPAYGWMGFYVGGNVGGSFGRARTDVAIAGSPFGDASQGMDGALGGFQAGYNWRTGRVLFGFETDIQATGQTGGSSLTQIIPGTPGTPGTPGIPAIPCILFDPPAPACIPGTGIPAVPGTPGTPAIPAITSVISYQTKLPWFGTARTRVGFTPVDGWLFYATGGLAYGEVSTTLATSVNGAIALVNGNSLRFGWTAGTGIEVLIASGWTVKLEYLYIDFGNVSATLIGIAPTTPVAATSHITDNVVRIGFNYAFGAL